MQTTTTNPITRKPEDDIVTFAFEARQLDGRFFDLSRRDKVRALFQTPEKAWDCTDILRRQGVRATYKGRAKLGGYTVELAWGRSLI